MPGVDFFVTPVDAHPILGLTDCIQLDLIKRVHRGVDQTITEGEILNSVYWAWQTWYIPHYQ